VYVYPHPHRTRWPWLHTLVKYLNVCRDVLGMIINRFGNTDIQNTCREPNAWNIIHFHNAVWVYCIYVSLYIMCFFSLFNNHKYKHSTYTSRHRDSGKTLVIHAEGVIVIIYYGGGVLGSWCGFAEFIYHRHIYIFGRERAYVVEGRVVRLLLFGFFDSSFRDCIKVCIARFAFTSIYVYIGRYK